VRHDLKRFVEQQLQPGDLVAIVRTSGGMGALDQFTTDRRLLLAAVDRLRWYPGGRSGLSAMEPAGSSPGAGQDARAQEAQWRHVTYSLGTLGAVSYLVNGMREMPGRKSLILISDGLRLRYGLGPAETVPRSYRAPSIWERDERVMEGLRRLADQANRAAVVLYSVDARGIQTLMPTAADQLSMADIRNAGRGDSRLTGMLLDQEGLQVLSHETGGFLVHDSNRIDFGLGQILQDLEGYYLIGYKPDAARFQPRNGKQPDFHAIKVQVKIPKLHVRSRSGYYGYEDSPQPAQDRFAAALFSPFTSSGVRLRLTPVFAEAVDGRTTITLMLHIDARDLTFSAEAGEQQATADLLAFTVDERGRPVDKASYKAIIRLKPARYEYALGAGLVYTSSIPVVRPGPYQVRVAVRDTATGKIGSASQFLEVPDLKKRRLALSGLVVDSPAGQPQDREAPGVPSFRVFRRSGALDFSCQIFNARLDRKTQKPALDTEVRVFQGRQQMLATEPKRLEVASAGSPRATAKGSMRLDSFEPGSYALQFVVRDTLEKEQRGVASQWIDFDVVP
jgi:VWFA-related protein